MSKQQDANLIGQQLLNESRLFIYEFASRQEARRQRKLDIADFVGTRPQDDVFYIVHALKPQTYIDIVAFEPNTIHANRKRNNNRRDDSENNNSDNRTSLLNGKDSLMLFWWKDYRSFRCLITEILSNASSLSSSRDRSCAPIDCTSRCLISMWWHLKWWWVWLFKLKRHTTTNDESEMETFVAGNGLTHAGNGSLNNHQEQRTRGSEQSSSHLNFE